MKTSLYKGGNSEHYFKIKHAAGGGQKTGKRSLHVKYYWYIYLIQLTCCSMLPSFVIHWNQYYLCVVYIYFNCNNWCCPVIDIFIRALCDILFYCKSGEIHEVQLSQIHPCYTFHSLY